MARRYPNDPGEHADEMRLIAHTTGKSNLRKRLSSAQHDDLSVLHSSHVDIGEGRLTESCLEFAREVGKAELHDVSEIRNVEAAANTLAVN